MLPRVCGESRLRTAPGRESLDTTPSGAERYACFRLASIRPRKTSAAGWRRGRQAEYRSAYSSHPGGSRSAARTRGNILRRSDEGGCAPGDGARNETRRQKTSSFTCTAKCGCKRTCFNVVPTIAPWDTRNSTARVHSCNNRQAPKTPLPHAGKTHLFDWYGLPWSDAPHDSFCKNRGF